MPGRNEHDLIYKNKHFKSLLLILQDLQATGLEPPHSSHCLETESVLGLGGIIW